ncbi:MAG: hypothetical protein WDW38_005022 [Sanguina aurantia]
MASLDDLLREFEDASPPIFTRAPSGSSAPMHPASLTSHKSCSDAAYKPRESPPSSSSQAKIPFVHPQSAPAQTYPKSKSLSSSSVDALLQDLDLHLGSSSSTSSASQLTTTLSAQGSILDNMPHRKNSNSGGSGKAKCIALFLGGTEHERGRNGSALGTLTCCNSMRCTKCDFKVISFDDQQWEGAADYLFFRNNYPTTEKLETMLTRLSSSVAYCCQCSWIATAQDVKVDYASELRWVCAGH